MIMNKKTIVWIIVVVIVILGLLVVLQQPTEEAGPILSADQVDYIPRMKYEECRDKIQEVNPEMSDQNADDNCRAIEAVNEKDPDICENIINPEIKQGCLNQFE